MYQGVSCLHGVCVVWWESGEMCYCFSPPLCGVWICDALCQLLGYSSHLSVAWSVGLFMYIHARSLLTKLFFSVGLAVHQATVAKGSVYLTAHTMLVQCFFLLKFFSLTAYANSNRSVLLFIVCVRHKTGHQVLSLKGCSFGLVISVCSAAYYAVCWTFCAIHSCGQDFSLVSTFYELVTWLQCGVLVQDIA